MNAQYNFNKKSEFTKKIIYVKYYFFWIINIHVSYFSIRVSMVNYEWEPLLSFGICQSRKRNCVKFSNIVISSKKILYCRGNFKLTKIKPHR